MPATIASYHGECPACLEAIVPGQRITKLLDETDLATVWTHVDCGERPERADCVCEKCWTVHVGECL